MKMEGALSLPVWKVDGVCVLFISDADTVSNPVRLQNKHLVHLLTGVLAE